MKHGKQNSKRLRRKRMRALCLERRRERRRFLRAHPGPEGRRLYTAWQMSLWTVEIGDSPIYLQESA